MASSAPADVNGAGGSSYSFSIVYTDNIAVDVSQLGTGDAIVTGPNGFSEVATLQSVNSNSNGSPRTATYYITPPGGSWKPASNGTYTIAMQGDQVFDVAGNATVGGALATFNFNAGILPSPAPGAPNLAAASDTGASSTDGITQLNNASTSAELQFSVGSTVSGATVTVFSDGVPIGAAVAGGSTTIVSTDGITAIGDGPHTITARQQLPGAGESSDSAGVTVTIDTTPPAVSGFSASDVSTAGATSYSFTITYADNDAVSLASLNGSETTVTTPGNSTLAATLVSVSPNANGSPLVATYQITPPGGSWTSTDSGTYTINFLAGHVSDVAGNLSSGGTLGIFNVNIATPVSTATGKPNLLPASDTGASSTDNITSLNNGSPAQALQFSIPNTIAGATVTLFADGTPIGAAVATGATTTITSTGGNLLSDGSHTITARQQESGADQSLDSTQLFITVDDTPPSVIAFSAPDVSTAGAASYTFTVTYSDNQALDISSFTGSEVTEIGNCAQQFADCGQRRVDQPQQQRRAANRHL